jgi:hypothetical protein
MSIAGLVGEACELGKFPIALLTIIIPPIFFLR